MFRSLLAAGDNFMTVKHDMNAKRLVVKLDRSKILSHGRPAIANLLLRLHIYRCTADINSCKAFYEELTRVEGVFREWRSIVMMNKSLDQIFVQANTFLEDGEVHLKEYEPTVEGVIQSWAERWI
jgi:dipeptidyl-peptidase-3